MPLLHQEMNRRSVGPPQHRRSTSDLVGLDTTQYGEAASGPNAAAFKHFDWTLELTSSPAVAETPRSLVPSTCFPPQRPNAYASNSESARPGNYVDEVRDTGQDIIGLVSSLAISAIPTVNSRGNLNQSYLSCERLDTVGTSVPVKRYPRVDHDPSRRASFCGVVSVGTNGSSPRWRGTLPARPMDTSAGFSPKVFLGGLPWDINETTLLSALKPFKPVKVEWPSRTGIPSSVPSAGCPRGFAYVTLENEKRVRALLDDSRKDGQDWYFRIKSRMSRAKEVQVIPWAVADANWMATSECNGSLRLQSNRTVFVGALHGMLSASALATIMNDLFANVIYAGIDTDRNKYPIGSGRVTFSSLRSYVRAISAAYVEICTEKFTKKVQVDPYLEDSMCSLCNVQQGPYFCRDPVCFSYYCRKCWALKHRPTDNHRPLMRSHRLEQMQQATCAQTRLSPPRDSGSSHLSTKLNLFTPSLPTSGTSIGSGLEEQFGESSH